MAQYIVKSDVVAEINKRIMDAPINHIGHQRVWAYNDVKDILNTLEVKEVEEYEQPEHSCFETTYKCGKKPHWNVGDTLAYYEFCSDREGESVLGKIANVGFDKEQSDWIYTFEDGRLYDEELLLEYETYKKK